MIFYYLDASAWVKRYYQETGTRWVQKLFTEGMTLTCASLGVVEVTATLARKAKAREISRGRLTQKVRELDEDWSRFIQIHLNVEAVTQAREVARQRALRGADAIHLASALLLRSRFVEAEDRLVFVASDHQLKTAAQSAGLRVTDPEEEDSKEE
ncbi:MAG: type II toxin-antitoxin system VapC family toxin [Deltaproteobacteria bacterium]|nr:type II toxin-antitoxin system VapC family toxin [Deltaproteobacteria bacterium]